MAGRGLDANAGTTADAIPYAALVTPSAPTDFSELNELLDVFVLAVGNALFDNLVGVYLQGSFAVGGADVHSDVDFIVITHAEVDPAEQERLQAMHARLFELPTAWAQHLEGSYVSADRIRVVDPTRVPLLYLDNGAKTLEWDNHCNTGVVRWTLREHGVALAGPPAASLVDLVTPAQLAGDVQVAMFEGAAWAYTADGRFPSGMSGFKQQFLVQFYCRALHTLLVGTVTTKAQASAWACDALEPSWRPLIDRAVHDRPDPWQRVHRGAGEHLALETLAFVDYATALASGRASFN
jgi:predicted nucleotidyltransferase